MLVLVGVSGIGLPVAVKVTTPGTLAALAVTEFVFGPGIRPNVQLVKLAVPLPSVVTVAGLAGSMLPPPVATVNVTATPATGLPSASLTITDGATATAVPMVAVCDVLEVAAIDAAAPAPIWIADDVTPVSVGLVNCSV